MLRHTSISLTLGLMVAAAAVSMLPGAVAGSCGNGLEPAGQTPTGTIYGEVVRIEARFSHAPEHCGIYGFTIEVNSVGLDDRIAGTTGHIDGILLSSVAYDAGSEYVVEASVLLANPGSHEAQVKVLEFCCNANGVTDSATAQWVFDTAPATADCGTRAGALACTGGWSGYDEVQPNISGGCLVVLSVLPPHANVCQQPQRRCWSRDTVNPASARVSGSQDGALYASSCLFLVGGAAVQVDRDSAALYAEDGNPFGLHVFNPVGVAVEHAGPAGLASEVSRATQGPPDAKIAFDPDGSVTIYQDEDGDGQAAREETVAATPDRPAGWEWTVRNNPDGTKTLYNDQNRNGQMDPEENRVGLLPLPDDGDTDRVPDDLEPTLCGPTQNRNLRADGDCAGTDWQAPTLAGLLQDLDALT